MNRRKFLFSIAAIFFTPKSFSAHDKNNLNLVLKNGWILKNEDL